MKSLSKRDFQIFESLLEHGFLGTRQIKTLHFHKAHKKTAMRRLSKLRKLGWLEVGAIFEKGEYIWKLSPKSLKNLGSEFRIKHINKNTLYHDYENNELKILFDQFAITESWRSSHFIKHLLMQKKAGVDAGKECVSDWLCALKLKSLGKVVTAMELELHLKSQTRWLEVLHSYKKKESIKLIWYVFPNERFGKRLFKNHRRLLEQMSEKQLLCYSVLSELKSDFLNAKVHFFDQNLSLRDFIEVKTKPAVSNHTTGGMVGAVMRTDLASSKS
jgi:hypothetical protein